MTEQSKKMVGINQLANGFTIVFKLLIKNNSAMSSFQTHRRQIWSDPGCVDKTRKQLKQRISVKTNNKFVCLHVLIFAVIIGQYSFSIPKTLQVFKVF